MEDGHIERFFQQYFHHDGDPFVSQEDTQGILSDYKYLVKNTFSFRNHFTRFPQFRSDDDAKQFVYILLDTIVYTEYCRSSLQMRLKDRESTTSHLLRTFRDKRSKGMSVTRHEIMANIMYEFASNDYHHMSNKTYTVSLLAYVLGVWAYASNRTPLYLALETLAHYYDYSNLGRSIHDGLVRLCQTIHNALFHFSNHPGNIDNLYGMDLMNVIEQNFGATSTDSLGLFEKNVAKVLDEVLFPLQTNDKMDEAVAQEWQSVTMTVMPEFFFTIALRNQEQEGDPVTNARDYFNGVVRTMNAMSFHMDKITELPESELPNSNFSPMRSRQGKTRRDEDDEDMERGKFRRRDLYV